MYKVKEEWKKEGFKPTKEDFKDLHFARYVAEDNMALFDKELWCWERYTWLMLFEHSDKSELFDNTRANKELIVRYKREQLKDLKKS